MADDIRTEKGLGLWWRIPLCLLALLGMAKFFLDGLRAGGWGALGPLILSAACLIVAALVIASPLAEWFAASLVGGWLGGLFYPDRRSLRPPVVYGPAEARRMENDFEAAIQAYEDILAEHPTNKRAYLALMDIAWLDMKDAPLAMSFYRRGMAVIKDEACRMEMQQAYEDFAPYLEEETED
jgi:tetratricopeptide (TPR) repeat protein